MQPTGCRRRGLSTQDRARGDGPAQNLGNLMRHVYDVLRRTWTAGLSARQIAQSLGLSRPTVANYVHRAQEAGLSWPLPEGLEECGPTASKK